MIHALLSLGKGVRVVAGASGDRQYVKAYIKFEAINDIDDLPIEQLMLLHSQDFIDLERLPKREGRHGGFDP